MDTFKGFSKDSLFLLSQNKLNDSRSFYEEHKAQLKNSITVPMRHICSDLGELLFGIDPMMELDPVKMVSRIRRDTRFSKNKDMYRDNIWAMFMRSKHKWNCQPCMWFEFIPTGYTIGVGIYDPKPAYMESFRKKMLEDPDAFRRALKSIKKVHAEVDRENYKKDKDGEIPHDLKDYYNSKYLFFMYFNSDLTPLYDGTVMNDLKRCIKAYAPMYKFLLSATEDYISKTKGGNEQ